MTTQTDRELLELAAMAAGMGMDSWTYRGPFFGMLQVIDPLRMHESGTKGTAWNPLTDDGDALRLAVKLKIPMQFPDWRNVARTWGPDDSNETFDETAFDHDGDLFAATRRAIVRAAAAIGSAM